MLKSTSCWDANRGVSHSGAALSELGFYGDRSPPDKHKSTVSPRENPCPSNGKKFSSIIIIHFAFATVHIHLQPSFLMLSVVILIKEAGSSIKVTKDASNRQLVKFFLTSRNCAYNHAEPYASLISFGEYVIKKRPQVFLFYLYLSSNFRT